MPLVMGTSMQLSRCPLSWGMPESPSCQDIIGKISYLEKAVADSIEAQKEQFKIVKDELTSLKAAQESVPKSPSVPLVTFSSDTPSTKKRKFIEEKENQKTYADIAGISQLGPGQGPGSEQQTAGLNLLQNLLKPKSPQNPRFQRNICFGSAKNPQDGTDCTKLSADVNLVATGVAKDCSEDNLKDYLIEKGINVVEVQQLTKPEVVHQVRTLTFRVAIRASDYEAALKPEIWPFRVGVRHYRAPRREDRPEGSWQGQSKQPGGNIDPGTGVYNHPRSGGVLAHHQRDHRHLGEGAVHSLPPGHPSRAGGRNQVMEATQPTPIDLKNMWSVLASLGSGSGLNLHP